MRSLHRYFADGVAQRCQRISRKLANDRYHGLRWSRWVTGISFMLLVSFAVITDYWVVWDRHAYPIALVFADRLDAAGSFGYLFAISCPTASSPS